MAEVCSCCKTISGRRSRPRPPLLSLEQPWKRAKAPHKHWSGPRKPPKLLQTKTALFSFGGLRGLWSRCMGYFWMQLFMAVPMTPSAAVADFGGRRYRRFIPFNFLLSLAAPQLHGVLVLVTDNKFMTTTPAINCSPVSMTPAITENPWQRLIAGVNNTGNKFFAGVV